MDRRDAFRTLQLDESADGQMVESAYWLLVRKAQERGRRDFAARMEIEKLNEAYATLQPDGRPFSAPENEPRYSEASPPPGTEIIDRAVDWIGEEALRTRKRWPHRNPEIAVIAGVTLVLSFIALGAGASFWMVLLCIALVFGAVWAPWRAVDPRAEIQPVRETNGRKRRAG
jgi:hypothetical protein